jgi:hypothetical protein
MDTLKILSESIFTFTAPETVLNKTKEALKTIDWMTEKNRDNLIHYGKSTEDKHLEKNINFYEFTKWSEECMCEVKNYMNFITDKFQTVASWANKSVPGQWHHTHIHPFSFASSIFYVQGTSGKTWFSRQSEWYCPVLRVKHLHDSEIIYKLTPIPGTLVIFPSKLTHSVCEVTNEHEERITISSNYLPTKKSGDKMVVGWDFEIY